MNLHLALISILEGLTEFLPISSTAHLIIFSKLSSIDLTDSYVKFYLLFIQLGALLAGASIFAKKIFTDKKLFINIFVSFIPSAIFGFIFYKMFKKLLEGNILLMAAMLILGGIIFIYIEKVFLKKEVNMQKQKGELTTKDAFIVGLAQAVAIIPGVSRSGATIIAGVFRNIKKSVIIEYTFILALPTLGAAVLYDAYKSREIFNTLYNYNELIFGFVSAFITGYITLFILRKYLTRISLSFFGWYRIVLALLIIFILY
jgi:undecaprenyl-diphosphatase